MKRISISNQHINIEKLCQQACANLVLCLGNNWISRMEFQTIMREIEENS